MNRGDWTRRELKVGKMADLANGSSIKKVHPGSQLSGGPVQASGRGPELDGEQTIQGSWAPDFIYLFIFFRGVGVMNNESVDEFDSKQPCLCSTQKCIN